MTTTRTGGTAYERIIDKLAERGRVRQTGDRAVAQCPAHEDRTPSLSLTATQDRTLIYCHAGCDLNDVLAALEMGKADLFDEPSTTYRYLGLDGRELRAVTREYQGARRRFRQSVRDQSSATPLYRLAQVNDAVNAGRVVYLVEGEEDVHAVEAMGATGTTAPMGAGSFGRVDVEPLRGAEVVAIADKDEAGRKWAAAVRDRLEGVAASLTFKAARVGKDASDHLAAGGALDNLADVEPEDDPRPRLWAARQLAPAQQPAWLAAQRLPKASTTILVGDEGIGKSLLWVWIVAAVTTGQAVPEFGIPARTPATVVLVITEDEWGSTVRPRLEVAGADLDHVQVICTDRDGSGSPIFPRDLHLIVNAEPRPVLVVVDAFLDTVATGLVMKDPQQARQALHPWKEVATITGAAILLLTHTNRVDSKRARDRYGITGELRKKARMTLYAQADDDGALVVGPEKSNIVGAVPASRFNITPVQFFEPSVEHDGTVPKLAWAGDSDRTAGGHLEAAWNAQHGEDADDRTEAAAWLEDYLASQGGTAESAKAKKAAKVAGFAERTLKRAVKHLGVLVESHGFPRTTMWTLPDPSGATVGPYVSERGPTGPTGADQRKHDGPTVQLGQSGQPASNGPTVAPLVAQLAPMPIRTGTGSTKIGGPRAGDGRPLPCAECGHVFHATHCTQASA